MNQTYIEVVYQGTFLEDADKKVVVQDLKEQIARDLAFKLLREGSLEFGVSSFTVEGGRKMVEVRLETNVIVGS